MNTLREVKNCLRTIVIGAGPAGLAVASELKRAGIEFEVLEKNHQIGGLWATDNPASPAYQSLTTNSSRYTTFLDQRAPSSWPAYFTRKIALQYLTEFSQRHQLNRNIRLGCDVIHVESESENSWRVVYRDATSNAECTVMAPAVIVCSGVHNFQNRRLPEALLQIVRAAGIPFVHASEYRHSADYRDKNVLVVGLGNSAAEIATEISAVARRTIISSRSVPWVIPLWVLGMPADRLRQISASIGIPFKLQMQFFHLLQRWYIGHPDRLGLGRIQHDLLDRLPLSDRGFMEAVSNRKLELHGAVRSISNTTIEFMDEQKEEIHLDQVLFATGYDRRYPFLSSDMVAFMDRPDSAFPMLIFHPKHNGLLFASEVSVPQGSWPLFALQARVIAAYLKAQTVRHADAEWFDQQRRRFDVDFKGALFKDEDRFHVDPRLYARALRRFNAWLLKQERIKGNRPAQNG